jgi:hypothetical protein
MARADRARMAYSSSVSSMLAQMNTGTSRHVGRRCKASSTRKPSNPGIIRSSTMASGRWRSISWSAVRPSRKHTAPMPRLFKVARIRSKEACSSSMTMTLARSWPGSLKRGMADQISSLRMGLHKTFAMAKVALISRSAGMVTPTTGDAWLAPLLRMPSSSSSPRCSVISLTMPSMRLALSPRRCTLPCLLIQ